MEPAGRPDRDGLATRPDTVGVGWPVAPRFAEPPPTVRWWLVAVVATASIWAPFSLLVAALGVMAVFGWSLTDDGSQTGGVDGSALGAVVPAVLVLVAFIAVTAALAAMLRAGTTWPRRRVLTVAGVLAVWAPLTMAVVLGMR